MQNSITIIADASWCPHTKSAGYGVWLSSNGKGHGFEGPLESPEDNNVAEAMAITNALWHGFKSGVLRAHTNVLIQSDSETAIGVLKGEIKAYNPQLKHALRYVRDLAKRYDLLLRYKHIPGHTSGEDKRTRAQNRCNDSALAQMKVQRAQKQKEMPLDLNPNKPCRKGATNYLRMNRRTTHG